MVAPIFPTQIKWEHLIIVLFMTSCKYIFLVSYFWSPLLTCAWCDVMWCQEYADAGTVKQNYVNILLMLLRLRQACDHPLLVKRYNSNSLWRSSVEMAKKLPQEKQISLLKCLEVSLALCSICNVCIYHPLVFINLDLCDCTSACICYLFAWAETG